jgi:hypothetical protein
MDLETKREKLLPCYIVSKEFQKIPFNNKILYIGNDGFCLIALRYYLYPVEVHKGTEDLLNFSYIISDKDDIDTKRNLSKTVKVGEKFIYIFK